MNYSWSNNASTGSGFVYFDNSPKQSSTEEDGNFYAFSEDSPPNQFSPVNHSSPQTNNTPRRFRYNNQKKFIPYSWGANKRYFQASPQGAGNYSMCQSSPYGATNYGNNYQSTPSCSYRSPVPHNSYSQNRSYSWNRRDTSLPVKFDDKNDVLRYYCRSFVGDPWAHLDVQSKKVVPEENEDEEKYANEEEESESDEPV